MMGPCCSPERSDDEVGAAVGPTPGAGRGAPAPELLRLAAGEFRMGAVGSWAYGDDGEGPIHVVELSAYGSRDAR